MADVKKLLLGVCNCAPANTETYKFQYFTVTITTAIVYINKALYKSQVADLAPLLTDDGKYELDVSLYRFKNEPLNKSVRVGKHNYPVYINWVNVKPSTDVYGDLKLYHSGLMSFTQLLHKYSKGIHIDSMYSSYELNRKLKSIVAVAKELSDYYGPDDPKPGMWNKLYPIETPVWEDPKGYYDPFEITVHINKYMFTLVNNSLRNSKFLDFRLTDELPQIASVNTVAKIDNNYIKDSNVKGITTKSIRGKYYILMNGYKLTAYNPNQSIECNKNGKLIPIVKDRAREGYYILKRQCLADATYTDNEEKEIFEYLTKDADTPLFIRGGTDKVIEQIEDIFYYAKKELQSSHIYLHIEEENSYDYDALNALISELNLKEEGYADNTISQHLDNLVVDEGFLEAFLYNEGINIEKVNDTLYIVHIR